jgi:hypothetical protein
VQGPDLFIRALPTRLALGRALLRRRGGVCRWHGHRDGTIGQRHGLLAQRRIDRVEGLAMGGEDLVQGFCEVLEEMKSVGHLEGRGRALMRAIGVGFRPIPRDHLHPWMLSEPVGQGLGGTIREERYRLAALQIDQHRAIALAFPQGEIVHAEDWGTHKGQDWQPTEHAQEGATADGHAQATAELDARCPAQGQGDVRQPL